MVKQGSKNDFSWLNKIQAAPELRPTVEEFEDFPRLMNRIIAEGSSAGILKLVHPEGTNPRRVLERLGHLGFNCRQQVLRSFDWRNPTTRRFFDDPDIWDRAKLESRANDRYHKRFGTLSRMPPHQSEVNYWMEMSRNFSSKADYVEYGNDIEGSAFEDPSASAEDTVSRSSWNLRALAKDETSVLRWVTEDIPGVTSPMLYIGMWGSTFAWHVEDHYLYSINYQHIGAAKTWYGVPASGADRLEQVVMQQLERSAKAGTYGSREALRKEALELLLSKATMFSPELLVKAGVPVYRAYQEPGDFILTFPRAYHGGFGNGYNLGEAVNFGLRDWFPYGVDCQKRHRSLQRQNIVNLQELLMSEVLHLQSTQSRKSSAMLPGEFSEFTLIIHLSERPPDMLPPRLHLDAPVPAVKGVPGFAEQPGLPTWDSFRVNTLTSADVTLLRCFVSYMRRHNAQLKLLEAVWGSLKFIFLDSEGASCTYDCSTCSTDCYLSTVVPQGAKPQCVGCALSFSTAKTSAVVLCHPRLLEWEAVARDVERCLSDCAVAPMECFLEDGLTRGEVDALNADDIPVPEPEHDYDWYSIPFQRNSSESSADATDNAVFEALMANRKTRASERLVPRLQESQELGVHADLTRSSTPDFQSKEVMVQNKGRAAQFEDCGPGSAGPIPAPPDCKFIQSASDYVNMAEPAASPDWISRTIFICQSGDYGPCLRARDIIQVIAGPRAAELRGIESALQNIYRRTQRGSQQMLELPHGGLCIRYGRLYLLTRSHVVHLAQGLDDIARSRVERFCQGVFAEEITSGKLPQRESVTADVVLPAPPHEMSQSSDQETISDHRAIGDSRDPSTCRPADAKEVGVIDERTILDQMEERMGVYSSTPASVSGGTLALGNAACEDQGAIRFAQPLDSRVRASSMEAERHTPPFDLDLVEERWLAVQRLLSDAEVPLDESAPQACRIANSRSQVLPSSRADSACQARCLSADGEYSCHRAPSASRPVLPLQFQHSAVPCGTLPRSRFQLASSYRQQARDVAAVSREGDMAWAPQLAGQMFLNAQARQRSMCQMDEPRFLHRQLDQRPADSVISAQEQRGTPQITPFSTPRRVPLRTDLLRLIADGNSGFVGPQSRGAAPRQRVVGAGSSAIGRQSDSLRNLPPVSSAAQPSCWQGSENGHSSPGKVPARLMAMIFGLKLAMSQARKVPDSGLSIAPSAKRLKPNKPRPSANGLQQGARPLQSSPIPLGGEGVPLGVRQAAVRGSDGTPRVSSLHGVLGDPLTHALQDRRMGNASALANDSAAFSSLLQNCQLAPRMSTLSSLCFEPREKGSSHARLRTILSAANPRQRQQRKRSPCP